MHTAVLAADTVVAWAAVPGTGVSDLGSLALRVRSTVEEAVRVVLDLAPRLTGPAPLCRDADYAHRISDLLVYVHVRSTSAATVADLLVYVRQHHAERDLAALGRSVLDAGPFGHAR